MRAPGFEVTEHLGGAGVVAMYRNGSGRRQGPVRSNQPLCLLAPTPEPAIRTGGEAMTLAVLNVMASSGSAR